MKFRKTFVKIFSIMIFTVITIISCLYLFSFPKVVLKGPNIIEVKYKENYIEPGYNAEFMGSDITSSVEIKSNINTNELGDYEIKYSVKNKIGILEKNIIRKVKVIDNIPPKIELSGGEILLNVGEEYIEPGYVAVDNYDNNITDKVIVTNNVNSNLEGKYEVKYEVKDSSNNEAIEVRNVSVAKRNIDSIPIFTYHAFMSDEEKVKYASNDKYTMSTSSFEEQLIYLKNNGYNTITLDEFYKWYTNQIYLTDKDIVIVMDDGHLSQYKYAIPLLEKYGFTATIFVITGRTTNEEQIWDPTINKYFSESIIQDILQNHKSIKLESHTHYLHYTINGACAMASKTEDEIYNDLIMSKQNLASNYLAYPFGCHTLASTEALKKSDYKMAFDFSGFARATKSDNIYAIKRININANVSMNEFKRWLEV